MRRECDHPGLTETAGEHSDKVYQMDAYNAFESHSFHILTFSDKTRWVSHWRPGPGVRKVRRVSVVASVHLMPHALLTVRNTIVVYLLCL